MVKQRQKTNPQYKRLAKTSDSDEETELFPVKKPPKERATVEKLVEEGDTLQSLAIRYRCTIEDLKRLNNIHKENEIFAKRTIKVPHHPFSMALAGVHVSGHSSPGQPSTSQVDSKQLVSSLEAAEVNQIIFNSSIKSVSIEDEEEDEAVNLLPQRSPEASSKICSCTDGDISLKALILCIVVLIFVVPLIYVFYVAEHPEQYHHGS